MSIDRLENASVLVVDDEPNMLRTLSAILAREGYSVDTAADGEQAIEKCQARDFDAVLMDVRMPRLDGVEAFRQIRRHRANARVILMSAYREDDLKQEVISDGAIAFIEKPLEIERVIRLISEAPETSILIIEDDEQEAQAIAQSLDSHKYSVTTVRSPMDGLKLVEQIRFDVIFIDVGLPVMNGLELYLAIKKISPSSVAVMLSDVKDEMLSVAEEAVQHTAYTIIEKPIDLDQLFGLLKRIETQSISQAIRKPGES